MYYVFWNENSFYVIDKDMNIINRFFTMDEAQQVCFYLNYNYKIYNNPQQEIPAIFPNPNQNLTSSQQTIGSSASLNPGVSYGNITINIPQHEAHRHTQESIIQNEQNLRANERMLNSRLRNNFEDSDQNYQVKYNNSYLNKQLELEQNATNLELERTKKELKLEKAKKQLEIEQNATSLELERAKKQLELEQAKKQLEIEQNASNLELEKTRKQLELQKLKKQLEIEQNASNLELQKNSRNLELEQAKRQLELEKNSSNVEIEKMTRALEMERANKQFELEQMAKQLELERMNKTSSNNGDDNQGSSFISANEITNFIKKLED